MSLRKIVKKLIPTGLFRVVEPYGHLLEAFIFNLINGFPARGLKVIGVTGTNGKTTTSFLIQRMLHEAGYKVGLMTTVGYGVGNDIRPQIQHMTNVSVPELMRRLKSMRRQGIEWLVLETTSHALAQNRVWGIPYSVAIMTNLTHEHLDYHRTFERYRDAKRKLFKLANRNHHGLRLGVINAEDPSVGLFAADIKNTVLYGQARGDLQAKNIRLRPSGVEYDTQYQGQKYHIKCRIPGSFNVYNSLAAVAVGIELGLSKDQVEQGIVRLEGVAGRMVRIDEGQDFDVIADYAHTPDSFEKIFKDLAPVVKGRMIVMFGTPGRRDTTKGTIQGELAGKYCAEVIITEEDDRDIDGNMLMEQVAKGAEKAGKVRGKDLFLVHDRAEAINFTIKHAKKSDLVLLLGKGHEKDILRPGPQAAKLRHLKQDDHDPQRVREDPWDEISTARQALISLTNSIK